MTTSAQCHSEEGKEDLCPTGARTLRAGVIGLGVGEAHVTAYQNHPACQVVALCDRSRDKLSRARVDRLETGPTSADSLAGARIPSRTGPTSADSVAGARIPSRTDPTGSTAPLAGARIPSRTGATSTGVELFESAGDLLNDPNIDVVSIASYDNDHYEQIVQALENDKHVFVEKPLCHREEEARHIRALLTEKPHLRLSSNLILRKCPRFIALKERIAGGALGELFLVEGDYNYGRLHKITEGWRGAIDFYSVVYGGAIHLVDLLLWLTGERITRVSAVGNQIASRGSQFRYNDTVVSALTFESGLVGKVGVSFGCVRPHFHGLSIYGTRATFINAVPNGFLYESCDPQVPPTPVTEPYPGVHKGGLIGSFIDSILYGGDPIVDEDDVFAAMSVCLAIEKAVATGQSCSVSYL